MIEETKWVYYKQAVFPDCAPHEKVDTARLDSGEIWKEEGKNAIFARYVTDFDCGYETDWWYIIKDDKFDIGSLNSKRRYNITRAQKRFYIERINSKEYVEDMHRIRTAAYSAYPAKYRPQYTIDDTAACVEDWTRDEKTFVFGAFYRETDVLCGYAVVTEDSACLNYTDLKVDPEYERHYVNYGIMAGVLDFFSDKLGNGYYITNGSRNIQHETNFQEWVERYFGYRKAYCKLNVVYNPKYRWIVKGLYVFRKLLKKFDDIRIIHKINGVLKMEEIVRLQKERRDT